jgi:hypothetical protein
MPELVPSEKARADFLFLVNGVFGGRVGLVRCSWGRSVRPVREWFSEVPAFGV